MLFNYHTHTYRCNHASGTEREYIEAAIKSGIKTLGFSDHAPYEFDGGYVSSFRMGMDKAEEYFTTVRALKEEYSDKIRILCGLELEYYPLYHKAEMEKLKKYSPDYLILGQHLLGNEPERRMLTDQTEDECFTEYMDQLIAAMQTGEYLYVAHPDMIGCRFTETVMRKGFTRFCEAAKELNVPIELNLLGIRGKRQYPDPFFFEIVGKVGCKVILGKDAHAAEDFLHPTDEKDALEMVKALKLDLITEPII